MGPLFRSAVGSVVLLASLPAQACLADACTASLHRVSATSAAGFELRLERIQALRYCDLPAAQREAELLWSEAAAVGDKAVAAAAAACAAWVVHLTSGAPAGQHWRERASVGVEGGPPEVLIDWCLARAGQLCIDDQHAEELGLVLRAQGLAEPLSRSVRQLRTALAAAHTVPLRGELRVRRYLGELVAAGELRLHEVFDTQFRFDLLAEAQQALESAAVEPQLQTIEVVAVAHGNRWLHAAVAGLRSELAVAAGDLEQGRHWREQAHARNLAFGNRMNACQDADVLAELAVHRGDLAEAHRRIDELQRELDGRGWRMIERNLLVTRHLLAEAEGDAAAVLELGAAIEAIDVDSAARGREAAAMRERLARAEVERAEFEQQLQAEKLRFAERAHDTWMYGALVGGSLLLALLGVSWFARRSLQRGNRELAAQFERAEAARIEREALEDRVRRIERAEGLGTLAAGVAHDFNNLLTGILGSAELLRDETSSAARDQLINSIAASGQQGARLCRQLQVYDADAPVTRSPQELQQVVREASTALIAASSHGLTIELRLDAAPLFVDLDRVRFEQVLLNLLQNARESGARSVTIGLGRGALAAGQVDAGAGAGAGEVPAAVVEVTDDGSGMSPEISARVFDPYFSTKFPGRGLGLAVVFGCVRQHGGAIEVESQPGEGTTFRIRLPLREPVVAIPSPPAQPKPSPTPVTFPAATVLVVDDEPQVRAVLHLMLKRLGVTAQQADGGERALSMVAEADPALPLLVFCDLSMPGLGGVEVCERVRGLRPDALVVLMSGHVPEHFDDVAQAVRPDATLGKPFELDAVRQLLVRLADVLLEAGDGARFRGGPASTDA